MRSKNDSGRNDIGGRAGRKASPWNRGPMCDTPNAGRSYQRYVERGQRPTHAITPTDNGKRGGR